MTTTKNSMTFVQMIGKMLAEGNGDFLHDAISSLLREVMAVEVGQLVGAEPYGRDEGRVNQRNGHRDRRYDTRVGTINLEIPRMRKGSYMPSFLEPRRRSEEALLNVIQEAYVKGVSTRKVEDLVKALGVDGVSKSEVSRICQALDEQVNAFRNRPLTRAYPYLWLDAKYVKVRENNMVVSNAIVVAYGLNDDGYREILGMAVGGCECEAFWTEFLRELLGRGLQGVRLVISDAHKGLVTAIGSILTGAAWQRCSVHFLRNVMGKVSKQAQGMVIAAVQTIFKQPDRKAADEQLQRIADTLRKQHPVVARMIEEAQEEILAYMAFPKDHWTKIHSTNLLERLNREIGRRADVVGIFPNQAAVVRLIGMVLAEQNDEWQVGRRYMSLESLSQLSALVILEGGGGMLPEVTPALAKEGQVA